MRSLFLLTHALLLIVLVSAPCTFAGSNTIPATLTIKTILQGNAHEIFKSANGSVVQAKKLYQALIKKYHQDRLSNPNHLTESERRELNEINPPLHLPFQKIAQAYETYLRNPNPEKPIPANHQSPSQSNNAPSNPQTVKTRCAHCLLELVPKEKHLKVDDQHFHFHCWQKVCPILAKKELEKNNTTAFFAYLNSLTGVEKEKLFLVYIDHLLDSNDQKFALDTLFQFYKKDKTSIYFEQYLLTKLETEKINSEYLRIYSTTSLSQDSFDNAALRAALISIFYSVDPRNTNALLQTVITFFDSVIQKSIMNTKVQLISHLVHTGSAYFARKGHIDLSLNLVRGYLDDDPQLRSDTILSIIDLAVKNGFISEAYSHFIDPKADLRLTRKNRIETYTFFALHALSKSVFDVYKDADQRARSLKRETETLDHLRSSRCHPRSYEIPNESSSESPDDSVSHRRVSHIRWTHGRRISHRYH